MAVHAVVATPGRHASQRFLGFGKPRIHGRLSIQHAMLVEHAPASQKPGKPSLPVHEVPSPT
jgi:hypothetical protein